MGKTCKYCSDDVTNNFIGLENNNKFYVCDYHYKRYNIGDNIAKHNIIQEFS